MKGRCCYNTVQYSAKFLKRHVAVASEAQHAGCPSCHEANNDEALENEGNISLDHMGNYVSHGC